MIEQLTLKLVGKPDEALIVHNGLLADREYKWTKLLAEVTSKRKKSDEDHAEVARLEWNGSLYFDDEIGPYLPGDNVRRCLLDAARLTKEGKNIERGVLDVSRKNPLQYDGPRTRDALWLDDRFRHRAIVKVGTSKVVRTRPKFDDWSATVDIGYDSVVIDGHDIERIAKAAGQYIGLCDGRPFFGGRFTAEVSG
ncbi:MAG: hypothetical protein AB7G17_14220 [Phycisphaerales bacterium]